MCCLGLSRQRIKKKERKMGIRASSSLDWILSPYPIALPIKKMSLPFRVKSDLIFFIFCVTSIPCFVSHFRGTINMGSNGSTKPINFQSSTFTWLVGKFNRNVPTLASQMTCCTTINLWKIPICRTLFHPAS